MRFSYFSAIAALCVLSACSSSPMQSRLDRNFIYNCSLELIDKDVPGADAERICSASHLGEMREHDRRPPSLDLPAAAPSAPVKHTAAEASTTSETKATQETRAPASEVPKVFVGNPITVSK
jgi:hypothetical protein